MSDPGDIESPPERYPEGFFRRDDETDDALFYQAPRLVLHIDDDTVAALTAAYAKRVPPGSDVLDLMSSWVSHLPPDLPLGRVAGLGMNAVELERNPRLSDCCVHDLNREPALPYADASFDVVLNSVSIQYLIRPVPVFRSVARVLRPGGLHIVALSHRCFPTKAIHAWHALPPRERLEVVRGYFLIAGGYDEPSVEDHSPSGADPLWLVSARRGTDDG